MNNTTDYLIAGRRIRLEGSLPQTPFTAALAPFATDTSAQTPDLVLRAPAPLDSSLYEGYRELNTFAFDDADADCSFGRTATHHVFRMKSRLDGRETVFVKPFGSPETATDLVVHDDATAALQRFGIWMMYGIAVTPSRRIAIHSSVIRCGDSAVMFLGESGTGKSTHTRLWREHIPGAKLLNDDSPIVGIEQGRAIVYGSPWSGKTPCYKNESCPIRAIVRLSQAPHNRIRRLSALSAIGALLPSCPPAFAYDETLQDEICTTLSQMLSQVPVYHLECLPDAAAAQLSHDTVFSL